MKQKRAIGYLGAWTTSPGRGYSIDQIPADQLTHVIYAFAGFSESGPPWTAALGYPAFDVGDKNADPTNPQVPPDQWVKGNFYKLLQLKGRYAKLSTLISIGGWGFSQMGKFADVAGDPASRAAFVASCLDLFIRKWPGLFDGIDVDWEFPAGSQQRDDFTSLLQEFRQQLDAQGTTDNRDYLLTAALPARTTAANTFDLPGVQQAVDWINLMAYDFHGTGKTDKITNFTAPLFHSPVEPPCHSLSHKPACPVLNINAVVEMLLQHGVPSEKLVLGIPTAGHGFGGVPDVDNGVYQPADPARAPAGTFGSDAIIEYNDLVQNYLPTYPAYLDPDTRAPYLYNVTDQVWISYENPESVAAKGKYVSEGDLGGLMLWELSGDTPWGSAGSLVAAMQKALVTPAGPFALPPTEANASTR
jgi:chitinase